jgi:transposase, IS5 family
VFGRRVTVIGGKLVRTVGIMRVGMKFGMQNLIYDIQRFTTLERMWEDAA